MNSIEQAREALTAIRKASAMDTVVMSAPPAAVSRFADIHQHADAALASLSPSTPVDGVGAEPRVKPLEWEATPSKGRFIAVTPLVGRYVADNFPGGGKPGWKAPGPDEDWHLVDTLDAAKAAAQADYEARILSALANPEAEARLRERVDVKQMIADVEAGKRDVFVNKGEDPHGNGSDLDCPYCCGSGHKDDAEARLAQAEGGPAVTEAGQ